MSAAEHQDAARLRGGGRSWREITELKHPGWSIRTVREAFARATRNDGHNDAIAEPFKISAADRLDVARLRKEGKTWPEISELKFPMRAPHIVRNAYSRVLENDVRFKRKRLFKTSAAERPDVAILRNKGMSWSDVTELTFPGWSPETVRMHFFINNECIGRWLKCGSISLTTKHCNMVEMPRGKILQDGSH